MSGDIAKELRAWAPLVASGYECPAASTTMHRAADALDAQEAENAALRGKLAGIASAITDGLTENGQATHRIKIASGTSIDGEFLIGPGADDIRNMLVTIRDLASVPSSPNKEDRNG